jgi:hypothetical protein
VNSPPSCAVVVFAQWTEVAVAGVAAGGPAGPERVDVIEFAAVRGLPAAGHHAGQVADHQVVGE